MKALYSAANFIMFSLLQLTSLEKLTKRKEERKRNFHNQIQLLILFRATQNKVFISVTTTFKLTQAKNHPIKIKSSLANQIRNRNYSTRSSYRSTTRCAWENRKREKMEGKCEKVIKELPQIFEHGQLFSSSDDRQGFGLHFSANKKTI